MGRDTSAWNAAKLSAALTGASRDGNPGVVRALLALKGDRAVDPTADRNAAIRLACRFEIPHS